MLTDIKQKALALVNTAMLARGYEFTKIGEKAGE